MIYVSWVLFEFQFRSRYYKVPIIQGLSTFSTTAGLPLPRKSLGKQKAHANHHLCSLDIIQILDPLLILQASGNTRFFHFSVANTASCRYYKLPVIQGLSAFSTTAGLPLPRKSLGKQKAHAIHHLCSLDVIQILDPLPILQDLGNTRFFHFFANHVGGL